jgi:hypothetical protein
LASTAPSFTAPSSYFRGEIADSPFPSAENADTVFVFALRVYKQLSAGDFDVDVRPVDAGHFDLDEVSIVVCFFHVREGTRSAVE